MAYLRELFGPSQNEIWAQLSQEIGAEHQGDFFTKSKVTLSHRQWQITLDTYTVHSGQTFTVYTRMRAPYVNQNGFRFTIYRADIFSWLGKLTGVQDVEIGDAFFDKDFVVQSSAEDIIRLLLTNANIRQRIERQPDIHFQVKDDEGWFGETFPEGVDELYFQAYGLITDKQRLKELFELFSLVLDELCRLGSAYQGDPGVKLK